jgi:hypothetical protein
LPGHSSLNGSAEVLDPGSPLNAFSSKSKLLQQVSGLTGIISMLGQRSETDQRLVQDSADVPDSLQQCGNAMIEWLRGGDFGLHRHNLKIPDISRQDKLCFKRQESFEIPLPSGC